MAEDELVAEIETDKVRPISFNLTKMLNKRKVSESCSFIFLLILKRQLHWFSDIDKVILYQLRCQMLEK